MTRNFSDSWFGRTKTIRYQKYPYRGKNPGLHTDTSVLIPCKKNMDATLILLSLFRVTNTDPPTPQNSTTLAIQVLRRLQTLRPTVMGRINATFP